MIDRIVIKIRNVYGENKAYPVCHGAECFARIAGTKTLTRQTLAEILSMEIVIETQGISDLVHRDQLHQLELA